MKTEASAAIKPGAATSLAARGILPDRFLVVSNRLPYQLVRQDDGRFESVRGVGGLVTALDPILRVTGGTWLGWSGSYEEVPDKVQLDAEVSDSEGYHLKTLGMSRGEVEGYYLGYANKGLWPLFHYFQEHCEFNQDHWATYREVNQRFADAIVAEYQNGDLIWIHDYHLMLVPALVRRKLPAAKIAFFLHIPFPSPEIFLIEPHAEELLEGVLGSDLVGFHVDSYARNFMRTVSELARHRFSEADMSVRVDGRPARVASFPISIDFSHFEQLARRESVAKRMDEIRSFYHAETVAIGVDRLDYTKGILERLQAIEIMLDQHAELRGRFTFVQISAPSRTKVEAYQEMRERVEQMVGRINGRFGGRGCIPIDYRYESQSQEELVARYRASDLALVTPLRDGMNLIGKEYVAARLDDTGALVLSRFAGAFEELDDATLVNPYDPETMARRIYDAIVMPDEEKRRRMHRMREIVRRNDIYWWLEQFLRSLL